jgi:AraC family carnitine catabolism transcriptional activator
MSARKFIFFLAPQFSMMSLLPLTEVLRKANELAEQPLYAYEFAATTEEVLAVNGMPISTRSDLPRDRSLAGAIVCASYQYQSAGAPALQNWLRWLARHGVPIGATDTGAFLVAQAGIQWEPPLCVHWLSRPAFQEAHPAVRTSDRLFEYTPARFSCVGAIAGLDLMLHILAQHHGPDFAARVGSHLVFGSRDGRSLSHQTNLAEFFSLARDPALEKVLLAMERSSGPRRTIPDLAAEAGLSQAQLTRLFKRTLSATPARVYQISRLRRAQTMIRSSALPIEAIAEECGFASRSQFTAAYKAEFGLAPSAARGSWDRSAPADAAPLADRPAATEK